MTAYRLNRMFDAHSGRCLTVAVDHGLPGELDLLDGIEEMEPVIDALVAAGPDALLLSPGQSELLQRRPGREKPALVLRLDVPDVYGREQPEAPSSSMIAEPLELAVRLDAACVAVNLLDIPERPSLRRECVANVMALRAACDRAGMPLMVEAVPLVPTASGFDVDRDFARLGGLVRQATELGADLVKADPLPEPAEFERVVRIARVPLLVRGGGRIGEEELFELTASVLAAGARGLVYGRNIFQHDDPPAMIRALAALVHEDASARDAEHLLSRPRSG